jgi:hypothetical protein
MSNGLQWAIYLSGVALLAGYLLAVPGLLILRRNAALSVTRMYAPLPLAMIAWWCAYLAGLGANSPFNIQEIFILAAIFVLGIYVALALYRQLPGPTLLPVALLVACLIAVLFLRLLTPEIHE